MIQQASKVRNMKQYTRWSLLLLEIRVNPRYSFFLDLLVKTRKLVRGRAPSPRGVFLPPNLAWKGRQKTNNQVVSSPSAQNFELTSTEHKV